MNIRKFLWLLILAGCATDPKPLSTNSDSWLLFGHFYGECLGEECIEIFGLSEDRLYEDTKDLYPNPTAPYQGTFVPLTLEKFEKVKDLPGLIPVELFDYPNGRIGMPDAGDWGGYFIQTISGDDQRFWLIDKNELYLPEELKPFASLLGERIALVK